MPSEENPEFKGTISEKNAITSPPNAFLIWIKTLHWSRVGFLLLNIAAFLLLWTAFVFIITLANGGYTVLPYPNVVIRQFFFLLTNPIDGNTLVAHVLASFYRVILGVLWAFILAIPIGIITASYPVIDKIFKPVIEMVRPIPPIAWIPFAIITFGLTDLSHAFVIFMGAFFPMLQNVYDGVKQSEQVYRDVGRSLGASSSQIRWEITLPSITPNIITGLRVAMGVGWMCVIAAEMMGIKPPGIGYFINYMKNIGNYPNMMAGMLMIAFVGLLINGFFKGIEGYFLRWQGGKQPK